MPSPCRTCCATAFITHSWGLSAGILLVLFLVCNLVAQFKAGGLIMHLQASEGVEETLGIPTTPCATKRNAHGR